MPLRINITCPADPEAIACVVEGLVALNACMMTAARKAGRSAPLLYASGVRYKREPKGREQWQSAAELLSSGEGDCEDLAAYRAAELRCEGELAFVDIQPTNRGTYHAVVRRGNGQIEDPSRILLAMIDDHETEV